MKKRVLSLFLALTLCLTLLPTAAFAEGKTGGEDGTSDGSEPQYVAQVGETKYETMQDALDEMSEDEITLLDDINEAELSTSVPTTINMNGYSITGDIEANDSLTLENGTVKGKVTVDAADGAFIMTAPAGAEAAIDGGLEVNDGSCSVSGAKIGVKDTLFFGGTDMVITGTDKAVELNAAAEPKGIELYGSATVDGETSVEAVFDAEQGTYMVNGEAAQKLSNKQEGGSAPVEPASLTLTPETANVAASETATFTATYTGTGTLNAYIQKNGLDQNFDVSTPTNNGDGTYTITVAISEDTPTGDYTLYVHETKDTSVQAMAKIHVKGKDPVAEVIHPGATEGTKYFSLPAALNAAQNGDTVTLLSDVDLGETYVTISKNITFDLGGKTLSSSKTWSSDGVLLVKDATVTVKNGKVKATGSGNCAIRTYRSGARMTLEDVTATVTSDKSSVMVGDFGSAVIKSGDYQGLYVGAKSQVTLEGGTFRPYMDNITNKNVKSIFWKVNETTDDTSRDCMELLGDGCVYVDETRTQVRTGGGFNTVVTVQQGTAIDAPVAKIGDVEYASLSKAINAVQNGGTITLLGDLNLGNGAVLQVGSSKKNFTIDLDSHTLSADGACLIMLHNGSQLTLKNGTLDGSSCTSYNGVLYISSNSGPKLTLESVTAKSGSVADLLNVQRSVPLVYVTNGTVVFDGGTYTGGVLLETDGNAVLKSGTFQKGTNDYSIKTKDSGKHLSDYLDDDSQFWDDNTPLDLSNETQIADEVTVRPCKHNWKNGKCTVCQKVCDHGSADGKSMTAATCSTCGMTAAAGVKIGETEKYFLTFNEALTCATQNEGCTLRLLANVGDIAVTTEKPFIFDLNGYNIYKLTVNSKIMLKDSAETKGKITENLIVEAAGLTVGDLLEDGYAFRSCLDGSWPIATVRTVGNVSILPTPIKSVTAVNPSVTVEYGKTADVTLTATVVPSAEDGTYSCQWHRGGGTMPPIEGAISSSYQLPADLSAGEHIFYLIATKGGYEKSCEFTVTVEKVNLRNAEIAFPYGNVLPVNPVGATGVPTFTVTCNGKKLEQFEDFEITSGGTFDGVGPCTLTVTAKENSNYTGSVSAEWKVRPLKIAVSGANIVKAYDGTTDLPTDAALTFKSVDDMYTGVTFGLSKGTDYQLLDASYASADAGEEKTVSFTVKLPEQGYVFADGTNETSLALKGSTVKINKAAAPSMSTLWQELHVFNDFEKTYEIELETLLPKRTQPCEYGTVTYGALSVTFTDTAYKGGNATLTNGVLRLPIKAASSAKSEIGTLTVEVNSTNYQTFTLTLHIIADDKIVLNQEDVTVSATDITYGQMLNESKLTATGTMKHPGTGEEVKGTFAWKNGTVKPDASDSYEAEWTFTPAAGYEEYAPATGTVTIKVKPAKLTVSVKASRAYYTGEAQIASIIASGQSVDSTPVTFTYSDKVDGNYTSGGPTFTDAGTYTAYYKAEAANHEPATGTFTVTIDPLPISLLSVSSISKTYDGSADGTLTASKLTFFSKVASVSNISLPDTALTITAQFTKQQADGSYLPSPEAGDGKALSYTMTLTSNNYVFEKTNYPKTDSGVFATDDANRFAITKAKAPAATAGTLNVINGTTLDYTFDFNGLLPTLSDPKTYGAVSYTLLPFTFSKGYYFDSTTTGLKDGELLLASLDATGATSTGEIGTITVKVSTGNYEDFTLTLNLYAVDKIAPVVDGGITASDITYGQTLSESSITGKMKNPDTGVEVEGTFEWTAPSTKPNKAGDYEAEWVFTPEAPEYATVTGKVTVKVSTAPIIEASVSEPSYTYDGNSHMPSNITVKLTDGTTLVENTDYTVSAEAKTDAGTYEMKIIGIGNYHGGDSKTYHWRITPRTVNVPTVTVEDGVYNGGEAVTPTVTVKDGETVIPASEYEVTYSNNTNAGTATVTVKDVEDGNYVLSETSKTFEITKAAGVSLGTVELTQKYTDTSEHTYTPDWSGLPSGQTWSYSSEYSVSNGSIAKLTKQDIAAANGKLTYAISGGKAGDKITITLKASCDNYEDFTITLNVTLTEKDDQKPLTITGAGSVVYGQTLTLTTTGGSGTGTVTYRVDTDHSTGEATIDPNTGVLTPVKVGSVSVIATKEGDKDYNDVTSAPFVLMIKPATPTGEPKYTKITTSGKTLKDAVLTTEGSTLNPKDGKLEWVDDEGDVLPDDTRVEANKTYKWRFTPTDTNYTTMTGEIELYHKSSSGGGSGSNSGSYTITVKDAQNGDVTTDRKSASAGTTVTITVKPDSGYVLDDLTVTDSKGNDIKLTGKGGGKYTFTMPSGKATVEASFTPAKSENPFTDVPSGAYYEDAVAWAVNNGITGGTSATTFAPDGFCTRAQAVTFLWRAAGSPAPKSTAMPFTDVPAGSYYYDAVLWAIENGVTKGTSDTTFSPNANCSRGQIVTFLWRSQKSPDAAAANPFTDVAANAYYTSAVLWAVEKSITGGTSATTFSPSANCTRAQIVTFIYRCMK